jgi:hypothetical protein
MTNVTWRPYFRVGLKTLNSGNDTKIRPKHENREAWSGLPLARVRDTLRSRYLIHSERVTFAVLFGGSLTRKQLLGELGLKPERTCDLNQNSPAQ